MRIFVLLALAVLLGSALWWDADTTRPASAGRCPELFVGEQTKKLVATLPTDAGMHAIWAPEAYAEICGYDAWEAEVLHSKDNEKHIRKGDFVPLYVHTDGTPVIELRVGSIESPARLTEAEVEWVEAMSEDYLFVSAGVANISGIEYIGGLRDEAIRSLALPAGRWAMKIHLLHASENSRSADDLFPPDFLVLANPEHDGPTQYGQSEETFDKLP